MRCDLYAICGRVPTQYSLCVFEPGAAMSLASGTGPGIALILQLSRQQNNWFSSPFMACRARCEIHLMVTNVVAPLDIFRFFRGRFRRHGVRCMAVGTCRNVLGFVLHISMWIDLFLSLPICNQKISGFGNEFLVRPMTLQTFGACLVYITSLGCFGRLFLVKFGSIRQNGNARYQRFVHRGRNACFIAGLRLPIGARHLAYSRSEPQ
jgi:hypothetical protein